MRNAADRYASVDDIKREVPTARIGNSGSLWEDTDIEQMIDTASAQIDSRLAAIGVAVPYDEDEIDDMGNPVVWRTDLLRTICVFLVASRLYRALPGSEADTRGDDVETNARAELRRIVDDPSIFLGGGVGSLRKPAPSTNTRPVDYVPVADIRW